MRFIVHNFLLNPGFWIVLFLLVSGMCYYKGRIWLVFLRLIFAMMFFDAPISYLVEKDERKFLNNPKDLSNVSHILVLGSGGVPDDALSANDRLNDPSLWRCRKGVEVWKKIPHAMLIFSSAGREGYVSQAEIYRDAVRTWGIPDSVMHVLVNGSNTKEEALDFKETFPEVQSLVLVTSALHVPRAKKIFEKYGLEVIPMATDFKIKRHPAGDRWHWIPSLNPLRLWTSYVKEKMGIIVASFE